MKRLLARSATVLLAAPLVLLAVQSTPTSTKTVDKSSSASNVAAARADFLKVMSSHAPKVGGSTGWVSPREKTADTTKAKNGTVTAVQSANWSGYADSESGSNTVSYVSGSWTIPSVTCLPRPYQNQDAFLANWVGVDGFSDSTVEQLGTAAQCYEGVEYYYVWYEMYPAGTVEEGTTACINDNVDCPRPGDRVTASVSVTAAGSGENNYTLTLTDHTRPQESFSTSAQCATDTCADTSGEWIVERPAVAPAFGIQILPQADFTRTYFSSGDITSGGVTSNIQGFNDGPVYDMAMIDDTSSYILSCVDQPAPPGTLLSATDATACPAATPTRRGGFEESWDSSF
jgi:Peptidase A4 family